MITMKAVFVIVVLATLQFTCLKANPHPLDPLTPDEILDTVDIIYATRPDIRIGSTWIFNWITLKEPPKSLLLPYFLKDSNPPFSSPQIPRRSFTVLNERRTNVINEVVVNLHTRVVESWVEVPRGTQATFTNIENVEAEDIAKADRNVQERCRQMGWSDMDLVVGQTWTIPHTDRPQIRGALRPILVFFHGKLFKGDNRFAHPFDFVVTVDLGTRRVIAIDNLPTHSDYNVDNREGNVCPKTPANFNPRFLPRDFHRKDVHPIFFNQPQGASYQIRGNQVTWQKFKFHLGFNGREGMVINHVSYLDGDRRRPLFYRMSVAELFVPYGDARPPYHQKFVFDEGEFTLGYTAMDLEVNKLCRGGAVSYFHMFLNDEFGRIILLPSAVCIYEEDTGILWGHKNRDDGFIHTRSTRLTVTTFHGLDNYAYKFSWHFYQDASILLNTELHGIPTTSMMAVNVTETGGFGTIMFPQVMGAHHQHFVTLRLDPEIDGNLNQVLTSDIVPLPEPTGSPRNPYGQGFTTAEKLLTTPLEARTRISPLSGRTWLIKNPSQIHPFTKKPVSWKLIPFNAPLPFVRRDSPLHPRCEWTDYNVWVTKYKDDQLYPGGFYLNASGLPEWVRNEPDNDLTNTDVVLWYIFGFTHVPKVEDFPVMAFETVGVHIKPNNFFVANPSIDVPPPP